MTASVVTGLREYHLRESHFFHRSLGWAALADLRRPFILRPRNDRGPVFQMRKAVNGSSSRHARESDLGEKSVESLLLGANANWHRESIEMIPGRAISNFQKSAGIGYACRVKGTRVRCPVIIDTDHTSIECSMRHLSNLAVLDGRESRHDWSLQNATGIVGGTREISELRSAARNGKTS